MNRLIVLDTETTGLDVDDGHRVIEIGCVEIIDRSITDNFFHYYINPQRLVDEKAFEVHGLSNDFLSDKPKFSDVVSKLIEYISDSALVIHNAPFDLGFLREEYRLSNMDTSLLDSNRKVYDALKMARRESPGKRNSLDALCGRYSVDNTNRDLHGALLDAKLLASVYLKMTQGQTSIVGLSESTIETSKTNPQIISSREQKIIYANKSEIESHQKYFQK